jgi:hypothetical protein
MASGTNTQIRRKIHQSEFNELIVEHETFLLHFLTENQWNREIATFISFFDIEKRKESRGWDVDHFEVLMDHLDVPYFELLTKDAVDLMVNLGYPTNWIINDTYGDKTKVEYHHLMMIIHKGKVFYNTQFDCYCQDTILENLVKLNPDLVIDSD